MGTGEVLDDQLAYFTALRKEVQKLVKAGKKPEDVKAAVENIKSTLQKQTRIARYVGDFLAAQVEKVYVEMGGKAFLSKQAALEEHDHHAHAHGKELVHQHPATH